MGKHDDIMKLCAGLGVRTRATLLRSGSADEACGLCWVLPLLSWHDESLYFHRGPEEFSVEEAWSDIYMCEFDGLKTAGDGTKGPDAAGFGAPGELALQFAGMNAEAVAMFESLEGPRRTCPRITFSHFVPSKEVIDGWDRPIRSESFPFNFSHVAGSVALHRQVQQLAPVAHVFGHSHRNRRGVEATASLPGTRIWANCLGYPEERKNAKCVFDGFAEIHRADDWDGSSR